MGGGWEPSLESGLSSTALLASSLLRQICFISCNTCSSTPSSRNASRTFVITSSITAWYTFSCERKEGGLDNVYN